MPYYIKRKKKKGGRSELQKWIAKLDKVMSLYVRMRDSKEFHFRYFRCISCGQVKPIEQGDCGHYISRTHMALRFDSRNMNCECRHCLTPDTRVLTSDFRWVQLGSVKVGDKLFGFDENSEHKTSRRYKVATVTSIERDYQPVFDVELENGDHVKTTADHKWLGRYGKSSLRQWIATKDLWINGVNMYGKHKTGPHTDCVTSVVCKVIQTVEQENSYEAGWIAGMIDADGHITQQNVHDKDGVHRWGFRVGVAQCEKYPKNCKEIIRLLEKITGNHKPCRQWMEKEGRKKGIRSTCQVWQFLITGTNIEKLQFLMRVRPNKLAKVDLEKLGKLKSQYDVKVKSITPLGMQEIVVMETDTHTFIAEGYAMHNCNRFCADHLIGYRRNLVMKLGRQSFRDKHPGVTICSTESVKECQRLGEQQVLLLEMMKNQTRKWSVFELQELYKYYSALILKMKEEL